jgi:hypothetical protein
MDIFKYKDISGSEVSAPWPPTNATEVNPPSDAEVKEMHRLLNDLTQAVLEFGPNKSHHMKVLIRHRTEWPYLWEKIDSILGFISSSASEKPDE